MYPPEYLDDNGNPIKRQPIPSDARLEQGEASLIDQMKGAYDWAFAEPLSDLPSRKARELTALPDLSKAAAERLGVGKPYEAVRGAQKKTAEIAGDVATGLTTRGGLAMLAADIATGGTRRLGWEATTKGLNYLNRAMAAPVAVEGTSKLVDPESTTGEAVSGGVNALLAGLFLGRKAPEFPTPVKRPIYAKNVTPPPPKRIGDIDLPPEAEVIPPGREIRPPVYEVGPDGEPIIRPKPEAPTDVVPYVAPEKPVDIAGEAEIVPPIRRPNIITEADGTRIDTDTGEVYLNDQGEPIQDLPLRSEPEIAEAEQRIGEVLKSPEIEASRKGDAFKWISYNRGKYGNQSWFQQVERMAGDPNVSANEIAEFVQMQGASQRFQPEQKGEVTLEIPPREGEEIVPSIRPEISTQEALPGPVPAIPRFGTTREELRLQRKGEAVPERTIQEKLEAIEPQEMATGRPTDDFQRKIFLNDAEQIKQLMKEGMNFDNAYVEVTRNYETDDAYEAMYNHVIKGPERVQRDIEPQEMAINRPTREQIQATNEGYAVLPPGYEGPFDNHVVIRTLSDGSRVIDPVRTVGGTLYEPAVTPKTPQEMRDELRAKRRGGEKAPSSLESIEPQEMAIRAPEDGHPAAVIARRVLNELDAKNAPDSQYKSALPPVSKFAKQPLGPGETWRDRYIANMDDLNDRWRKMSPEQQGFHREFDKSVDKELDKRKDWDFEDYWKEAIKEAEAVGIDWRKYDDVGKLYDAISDAQDKADLLREQSGLPDVLSEADVDYLKNIFSDQGVEWEPRPNDPPEIAALRQEMKALADKQDAIVDQQWEEFGEKSEGMEVLNEKDARRFNELGDQLAQYDKDSAGTEPQHMKVPGINPQTGRENIAMGGASPTVIRTMGTSLYTGDRPRIMIKEMIQNSGDEHKIAGVTEPIRILMVRNDHHPLTGEEGPSITVRDRGRGMGPDELYTVFTDLGESGKRGTNAQVSAGGFGFAKAAPMQAGKYVQVHSVKMEGKKKVRYSFEGDPDQLLDQKVGVPLKSEDLTGTDVPTGLTVKTYFKTGAYLTHARDFAKKVMAESRGMASDIEMVSMSVRDDADRRGVKAFLNYRQPGSQDYLGTVEHLQKNTNPPPQHRGRIETAGASVDIYFDDPPAGSETQNYEVIAMNKGMFQLGGELSYGPGAIPGVPTKIYLDIAAKVEPGFEGYPYNVSRENLEGSLQTEIIKWVHDNVSMGALNARTARIQQAYDGMMPFIPTQHGEVLFIDQGGRFTPDEINAMQTSPAFQKGVVALARAKEELLHIADGLGWKGDWSVPGFTVPSARLQKYALLFAAPHPNPLKGTTLGIHIPNPSNMGESAIAMNLMEHLQVAVQQPDPLDYLGNALYITLTHELGHVPGGPHDAGFAYRHADLLERLASSTTFRIKQQLASAFGDIRNGQLNPEILDFLQVYRDSRQRPAVVDDPLLGTGINEQRPTNITQGEGENVAGVPTSRGGITGGGAVPPRGRGPYGQPEAPIEPPDDPRKKNDPSFLREAWNLSRGIMSTDLPFMTSAALRQGLRHFGSGPWFKAWYQSVKAYGSKKMFMANEIALRQKPIMKPAVRNAQGRTQSVADMMGLRLIDLDGKLSGRDEQIRSTWAEKIPLLGIFTRASNRGYAAFMNTLRINAGQNLFNHLRDSGQNPVRNVPLLEKVGSWVNNTTGAGDLSLTGPRSRFTLERYASGMAEVLFSPRMLFTNFHSFNPYNYFGMPKGMRMKYWESAARLGAAWMTFAGLAHLAGAEVDMDPNSSDFGKIKIGNTRLDPAAGVQQVLVLLSRMGGHFTSSTTGKSVELGSSQMAPTRGSIVADFMGNKMHPSAAYLKEFAVATKRQPLAMGDQLLQQFTPMVIQDLIELSKSDDPLLKMLYLPLISHGWGTQTYDRGPKESLFIDPENDVMWEGGAFTEDR